MKRLSLFLAFAFSTVLAMVAQSTIQLTTSRPVGEEFVMTLYSTSSNDPFTIDWGDGSTTTHNVSPTDIPYFQRIAGTLRGNTLTITGNIVHLTATEQAITSIEIANQTHLKELCLSQNELSQIAFVGDVAPLQSLQLNNNLLTNSTENNPTLGLEVFASTLIFKNKLSLSVSKQSFIPAVQWLLSQNSGFLTLYSSSWALVYL